MQPGRGRDVEIEGEMQPVGNAWANALAYCAIAFTIFWIATLRVRDLPFIVISGLFAAYGFVILYFAMRTTLDARAFGAMKLRAAAIAPRIGGRFMGSLRISESAAVRGAVRAELRCNEIWYDGTRREQTIWSEERRFPIRRQVGGSYAILEFDIPAGMPPSEVPPAGEGAPGRRSVRWELQAIAESDGAYRDELYGITVQPAKGAATPEAPDDALPLEVIRRVTPEVPAAPQPKAAAAGLLRVMRAAPPLPRVPKPVEQAQDLAEPEVLPPAKADPAAIVLLIAANLVPLAGVAFWGWQVQQVVFLYWMENLVIGGFNVLRILALEPRPGDTTPEGRLWIGRLAIAGFFTVHYGFFCFVHGQLLAGFFGRGADGMHMWVGGMVLHMLHQPVVIAALVALLVSHGWSYFRNYLGRGEYQRVDGSVLMSAPYKRIFITHLFIIFGAFLLNALKSQLLPMLLFVGLKTGFDLYFHRLEHRGQSKP